MTPWVVGFVVWLVVALVKFGVMGLVWWLASFAAWNVVLFGTLGILARFRRPALPPHLADRPHEDWPWPWRLVPRSWTAWSFGQPRVLHGFLTDDDLIAAPYRVCAKPITSRGTWQVSFYPRLPASVRWFVLYVAFTTPGGIHFRDGARPDDVDWYTELPSIAIKTGVE